MIIPNSVKRFYEERKGFLKKISNLIKGTLYPYCEKNGYAYKQRTKNLESFFEKLESGKFESVEEINDLVASTVIIPRLELENDVIDFLKKVFNVEDIRKRNSTKKAPEFFRFDSTRIICKLKNTPGSKDPLYKIPFEVQILTFFEYAWQVATHSLTYKSAEVDWKLLRLASQLRASVEQLDLLVSSFSNIKDNVQESEWVDISIKKEISRFVNKFRESGDIGDEHLPKDLSRLSDNDNMFSLLNETIQAGKISDINYVSKLLSKAQSLLKKEKIPKSISLQQFLFVCLLKEGKLIRKDTKFNFLITQEVKDIYPDLGKQFGSMKEIKDLVS